ncbi:MAG: hypothetical protein LBB88_02140, partial [Planctomycetaceae bacterium]|nr:hypothetical protein [Planctomycetaceae bacterium]
LKGRKPLNVNLLSPLQGFVCRGNFNVGRCPTLLLIALSGRRIFSFERERLLKKIIWFFKKP